MITGLLFLVIIILFNSLVMLLLLLQQFLIHKKIISSSHYLTFNQKKRRSISRILSSSVIYLDVSLPLRSNDLPSELGEQPSNPGLHGLSTHKVYPRCASLPTS